MSEISLLRIGKTYGTVAAVQDFTLRIGEGELVALLGPSGCGKTTTLRMIAGFILPSVGQIRIGERDVTGIPPHERHTGMVFQGYALFPHMTAAENVAFGLEMRKIPRPEIERRVKEALGLVRLEHLGGRYPKQLSGGQQQRVALARALVIKPDVLLLDEPLSNLDAKLRHEVRLEIRQLQQELGLTTVFVTHDQEEALTVADRLVVMNQGRIAEAGTPQDLYNRPRTAFVADFIGKANIFAGAVEGDGVFRTEGGLRLIFSGNAPEGPSVLAVRPEQIRLLPGGSEILPNAIPGVVRHATFLGAVTETIVALESGEIVSAHAQSAPVSPGAEVVAAWTPEASLMLEAEIG